MILLTLLPSIIYFAIIGFVIWFAIRFINIQKERNIVLKEISNKLNGEEIE